MKTLIFFAMLSGLAACATAPDTADKPSYVERRYTTGSNLPRKGQADTVDQQSAVDQLNRAVNIGPSGPAASSK